MEREVKKPPKKSLAKAAGLKSTFVISPQEKELAMTAFGRGNDALLQKRIVDGVVRDVAGEKQQFQVQRQDESQPPCRPHGNGGRPAAPRGSAPPPAAGRRYGSAAPQGNTGAEILRQDV